MRLSYNRIAALLFAILSLLPIVSVALIIDALDGIGQVSRAVEAEPSIGVLLVELGAIGVLTVVFAAVCVADPT